MTTPRKRNFIGVDPAAAIARYKKTGKRKKPSWMAFKGHSGWITAKIDIVGASCGDASDLLLAFLEIKEEHAIDAMIIEAGFIGQMGMSALKLENVRGQLRMAALAAGLWVPPDVAPKKWMEDITGERIAIGHDELARLWTLYAKDVTSYEDMCEDEAAAVCIATYANAQHWDGY